MKVRYYTYDKEGIVTKHYVLITAFIKVLYQALILGIDSSIDKMYHSKGYYKTIFKIKGLRPFRKMLEREINYTVNSNKNISDRK